MKKNGFTLIELIVVITIIAVITVVGVVNYGQSNRKARDSRRAADLEKIRIALEMAKQVGVTYPAAVSNSPSGLTPNYISSLPTDPKRGANYFYVRGATNYTYSIGASMEDPGSTNSVTVAGCSNCNYGVTNP